MMDLLKACDCVDWDFFSGGVGGGGRRYFESGSQPMGAVGAVLCNHCSLSGVLQWGSSELFPTDSGTATT